MFIGEIAKNIYLYNETNSLYRYIYYFLEEERQQIYEYEGSDNEEDCRIPLQRPIGNQPQHYIPQPMPNPRPVHHAPNNHPQRYIGPMAPHHAVLPSHMHCSPPGEFTLRQNFVRLQVITYHHIQHLAFITGTRAQPCSIW